MTVCQSTLQRKSTIKSVCYCSCASGQHHICSSLSPFYFKILQICQMKDWIITICGSTLACGVSCNSALEVCFKCVYSEGFFYILPGTTRVTLWEGPYCSITSGGAANSFGHFVKRWIITLFLLISVEPLIAPKHKRTRCPSVYS